ncbi:hypothetical protein CPC08DRAFT_729313 [Agrocybe pediades]|nr:hypothetical protein CPC08DRAFT_729313 [Agrocybe pediades]
MDHHCQLIVAQGSGSSGAATGSIAPEAEDLPGHEGGIPDPAPHDFLLAYHFPYVPQPAHEDPDSPMADSNRGADVEDANHLPPPPEMAADAPTTPTVAGQGPANWDFKIEHL